MRTLKEYLKAKSEEFTDRYDKASIQKALKDIDFVKDQLKKTDPGSDMLELIYNFSSSADACFALNEKRKAFYSAEAIHTIRFASLIRRLYELKPYEADKEAVV
jgi:hypothetical protein